MSTKASTASSTFKSLAVHHLDKRFFIWSQEKDSHHSDCVCYFQHGLVDAIRGVAEERLECFETEPIKNSLTRQNERWRDNLQKYAGRVAMLYLLVRDLTDQL